MRSSQPPSQASDVGFRQTRVQRARYAEILEAFYAGFTPGDGDDAGYFVSEGDPGRLPAFLRAPEPQSCEAPTRVRFRSTSLIG